jgi:hypothetical protein
MTSTSHENVVECQNDMIGLEVETSLPASARDLFTHQTGQILVELGNVLVNAIPFSDEADRNTGTMLISIGNKLKRK